LIILDTFVIILLGLLGGFAVGVQGPIANSMSQRIGGTASSLIVHVSGALISAFLLFARGGEQIQNWRALPWYMFISGAFGVVLYLTLTQTMPRLGATTALVLIIVGQLTMGMLIDQFGWFDVTVRAISATRVLAIAFLVAGGYLMLR
jgi:bacterial/archaeal transporter family-2 protein